MRRARPAHSGEILREDFAAEVTAQAHFAVERFSAFQDALREMSNGVLEGDRGAG